MLISKDVQEKLLQTKEGILWTSSLLQENANFFIKKVKDNISELMLEDSVCGRTIFVGYLNHSTKQIFMAYSDMTLEENGPIKIESYGKDISKEITRNIMTQLMDTLLIDGVSVDREEFMTIGLLDEAITKNKDMGDLTVSAESYLSQKEETRSLEDIILSIIDNGLNGPDAQYHYLGSISQMTHDFHIPYQLIMQFCLARGDRKEEAIVEHKIIEHLIKESIPEKLYALSTAWTSACKNVKKIPKKNMDFFNEIMEYIKSHSSPHVKVGLKPRQILNSSGYAFLKNFSPLHFYDDDRGIIHTLDDIELIKINDAVFHFGG